MGIREVQAVKSKSVPQFAKLSDLPNSVIDWLSNHQNSALIIWDQYDRICYCSQSMKRLFGYEPSETTGQLLTSLLNQSSVSLIKKQLKKDSSEPQVIYLEIMDSQQRLTSIEGQVSQYWDEKTGQHYYRCYIWKYLKHATSKEELVFSEKMSVLGQLTAGIAHEIRNPLTSIKGFLQLLQAGVNHKEEYYQIMLDEIEKMESVTAELLNLAKPLTDERKTENVSGMVQDVITLLRPEARMKKIEITTDLTDSLKLYCNRSQIKQILINLIKNAIEAMDEPGEIEITTFRENGKLSISIRDEGIGLPPEVMKQLGEPFFTTKKNGTGLGLMITKQILDQHDGSLVILNNKEKGTTFRLQFPE